jgi:vitamin B12 transporter
MRGTKTAQTLVLVDGVKINSASSGAAALETLSVDQIQRIEVVKGARSAVYGADAIGGVIQIFTRRADNDGINPRLRLAYGSNQTWQRSVGISGGDDDTRYSLSYSSDDTQGINRSTYNIKPADADRDVFRNNALNLTLSQQLTHDVEVGLNILDQRGEAEYDQSSSGNYPYDEFQLSSFSGHVNAQVNPNWHSRLELGHMDDRRFYLFDDNNTSSSTNTYRNTVAWINDVNLTENQALALGVDYAIEDLSSSTAYAVDSRWNRAVFIQHQFDAQSFSTKVGVRHDDNEIYGNVNTFNGSLTLPVNQNNKVIASYSEGFRAPSFVDLYGMGGNADLEPETSKNYEIQWHSELTESTQFSASIYRSNLTDMLSYDNATYLMGNIGSARIDGFEAALQTVLLGWNSNIALSVINPRDQDTGKVLVRRAKRTLNIDVDRQFGNFSVGSTWSLVSSAPNVVDTEIPGRGLLAVRGAWTPSHSVKLELKVDNVLNKDYASTYYGDYDPVTYALVSRHTYREPGRTAMLAVTWTPKY